MAIVGTTSGWVMSHTARDPLIVSRLQAHPSAVTALVRVHGEALSLSWSHEKESKATSCHHAPNCQSGPIAHFLAPDCHQPPAPSSLVMQRNNGWSQSKNKKRNISIFVSDSVTTGAKPTNETLLGSTIVGFSHQPPSTQPPLPCRETTAGATAKASAAKLPKVPMSPPSSLSTSRPHKSYCKGESVSANTCRTASQGLSRQSPAHQPCQAPRLYDQHRFFEEFQSDIYDEADCNTFIKPLGLQFSTRE